MQPQAITHTTLKHNKCREGSITRHTASNPSHNLKTQQMQRRPSHEAHNKQSLTHKCRAVRCRLKMPLHMWTAMRTQHACNISRAHSSRLMAWWRGDQPSAGTGAGGGAGGAGGGAGGAGGAGGGAGGAAEGTKPRGAAFLAQGAPGAFEGTGPKPKVAMCAWAAARVPGASCGGAFPPFGSPAGESSKARGPADGIGAAPGTVRRSLTCGGPVEGIGTAAMGGAAGPPE
jgi:hypothetical protein